MAANELAVTGCNIYRDGDHLVAALEGAVFPNRCVVTNAATETRFRYRAKITPRQAEDMARYGARYGQAALKGAALAAGAAVAAPIAVLGAAAIIATMKTVVLEMGLSAELAARYRQRKRRALYLVFGGLAAAFLLPGLVALAIDALFPGLPPATIGLGVVAPLAVIFFLTMIAGLIYFAVAVRQPLQIRTTDGHFAWFTGAHSDFLAALPTFPKKSTAGEKGGSSRAFILRLDGRTNAGRPAAG